LAVNNLVIALLGQGKLKEGTQVLEAALQASPPTLAMTKPFLFSLCACFTLFFLSLHFLNTPYFASIAVGKKRELLIEVAKWSGNALRTTCHKMPSIEIGGNSSRKGLRSLHRPGTRPTRHLHSISKQIGVRLPRLYTNYSIFHFATWRNRIRVSVRSEQVEYAITREQRRKRKRREGEERELKADCAISLQVRLLLRYTELTSSKRHAQQGIGQFRYVRFSTLNPKGSIHTCPGLLDLRRAQQDTANFRHVHFATLNAKWCTILGATGLQ
jgi:hypothetical protein